MRKTLLTAAIAASLLASAAAAQDLKIALTYHQARNSCQTPRAHKREVNSETSVIFIGTRRFKRVAFTFLVFGKTSDSL